MEDRAREPRRACGAKSVREEEARQHTLAHTLEHAAKKSGRCGADVTPSTLADHFLAPVFRCPSAPASRCPRRRRALDDRATQRVRRVCCRRRLARPHASALVWHTPHRSPTSARRVGSAATPSCQRRAHGTCRSRRASTEGCNSLGVAFREPCSSRARHATGRPLRTSRPAFSRWAR